MKQLYFFAAAVLFGTVVSAQAILPAKAEKDSKTSHVKGLPTEAVMRDAIWSHDCNTDNCSDWVFGNGSAEEGEAWFDIEINFECTTDVLQVLTINGLVVLVMAQLLLDSTRLLLIMDSLW